MFTRAALWMFALLLVAATGGPCAVGAEVRDIERVKTPIDRAAVETPASGPAQPGGSAGTTLVLLGLLLAGAIVGRRLVQLRVANRNGKALPNPIRLVGRQQIDSELNIRLLQVGSRLLVVAATPQGVATLAEVTDPEEVALLTGETGAVAEALFAGRMPIAGGTGPSGPADLRPPQIEPRIRRGAQVTHAVRAGG